MTPPRRWLVKSEPTEYSIDDLARDGRDWWTGVRNYQARNFMRDEMAVGDSAFFYHSSCAAPGVVGIAKISAPAKPDPTQFDPQSEYFDPRSDPGDPRWFCAQIEFARKIGPASLARLRACAALSTMIILRRGNRLSITPVTGDEWRAVCRLAGAAP